MLLVQKNLIVEELSIAENWRYIATTGKPARAINKISDGRLLVNYGDSLEILNADGCCLSEVKLLYQDSIDYVAVSGNLRVAYIVQKVNAGDHTEQLENLLSPTPLGNTSSSQGALVISAWQLPNLSQAVEHDIAFNNKCIAQAWFSYDGICLEEHITVSAIASKSDWKEIYVGLTDGYLGKTTLDESLTASLDISQMSRVVETKTNWLFGHPQYAGIQVRCAISTLEWLNDIGRLLVHYRDGNARVVGYNPETKLHDSIVLDQSAENPCNRDSLGMFMSRDASYLMKISKRKVGIYIDK